MLYRIVSYFSSPDVATRSQLNGVRYGSSHHDGVLRGRFHQHCRRLDAALTSAISAQEQRRNAHPEDMADNAAEVNVDGAVENNV